MADTTFIAYDQAAANRVKATWLNDVNRVAYGVASVAALMLLPTPNGPICVQTKGYRGAGTIGGGIYRWDATSSATHNAATVIRPTAAPTLGRWLLMTDGSITFGQCGAYNDGVTDNSLIWTLAVTLGIRLIWVEPGNYNWTQASAAMSSGVCVRALSSRGGGGDMTTDPSLVNFIHSFNGDWFTLDGADGVIPGLGYEFWSITFEQGFGTAGNAYGNCFKATIPANTSRRPTWLRWNGCGFEQSTGKGVWTRCIYIDGNSYGIADGTGVRDVWFEDCRFLCDTGGTASIEALNCQNINFIGSICNGAKGDVILSGKSTAKSQVYFVGGGGGALSLDWCSLSEFIGQAWSTITATANVTSSEYIGRLTVAPTARSGIHFRYRGADNVIHESNAIAFDQGLTLGGGANGSVLNYYDFQQAFTPTLTFGGAAVAMTGAFAGRYSRVGGMVFFTIEIQLTAKGSSTGTASVAGLPFASANILNCPAALWGANMTSVSDHLQCYVAKNAATMTFGQLVAGTSSFLTDANFSNTTQLLINGSYPAA